MNFFSRLALSVSLSLLLHGLLLNLLACVPGTGIARHPARPPLPHALSATLLPRPQTPDYAHHAEPAVGAEHGPAGSGENTITDASPETLRAGLQRIHGYYFSPPELDRKPSLLADVNPTYPPRAASEEAVVVHLRLLISASGRVDHAVVENVAVPTVFAQAAIDAFMDARFAPGQREQQAVPSQMRVELRYTP